MTHGKSAGASRRGRRHVLILTVFVTIALGLLFAIRRSSAHGDGNGEWERSSQRFGRPDAVIAAQLLQSVAGANNVLCAAVDRAFQTGSWGMSVLPLSYPENSEEDETARWIGRNHIDRGALEPARRGLASADACTRRIAARIAGNVAVNNLEQELEAELASASATTQAAAVMALGYSEQTSALPRLRRLVSASDLNVRLAAVWALGSIEDRSSVNLLVDLLRNDRDADIRRLAAWALGRIEDR